MEKKGMKGSKFPNDHWEKSYDCKDTSDMRYTQGSNPENLKRNSEALASYVKKNKAMH